MAVAINNGRDLVFKSTASALASGQSGPTPRSEEYIVDKAQKVSLATGENPEDVALSLALGREAEVDANLRTVVQENVTQRTDTRVAQIVNGDVMDDSVQGVSSRYLEDVNKARTTIIPEVDAHILGDHSIDSQFKEANLMHQRRSEMMKKLFAEQMEGETGLLNAVGDFVDVVISSPYTEIIEGGGFTRGDYADRLIRLIDNGSITDEEFLQEARGLLREVADSGLFTETNSLLLGQLMENYESGDASLDKAFTVLEGTLLGLNVAKKLLKARGAIGLADAVSTPRKSTEMRTTGALNGTDPEAPVHTAPASINANADRIDLSSPDAQSMRQIEQINEVNKIIEELDFGWVLQPEDVERVVPRVNQELADAYKDNTRMINYRTIVDDKRGNVITRVAFGKSTKEGAVPFKNMVVGGKPRPDVVPPQAKKLAEDINGVAVKTEDGKGWIVVREDNVKIGDFISPTKESQLNASWWSAVASTYQNSSFRLDRILKRGEAQLGVIDREISKRYRKAVNSLSKIDFEFMNKFFSEYQQGSKSFRTKPLTDEDFINDYHDAFGKNPSKKTVEAFRQTQELNDATYWIEANKRFRSAVEQGEQVAKIDGTEVRVRVTPNRDVIPGTRHVFDTETGTTQPISKIDKKKTVYEVSGGFDTGTGKVMYVTGPVKTRRLYHSDVLGYNAGGPRIYDQSNWFIKQDRQLSFSDGTSIPAAPRTFMSTFSEAEADLAVANINGMLDELRDVLPELKKGRFEDHAQVLVNSKSDPDVQDIISRYAEWNVNIEDAEDLVDFFKRYNLSFKKNVGKAADGEPMMAEKNGEFSFAGGYGTTEETYKDVFVKQSNSKRRRDIPLIGYGGTTASSFDPMTAIQRSFTRAINGRAEEAYMVNAVEGWLKGASKLITNPQELVGMSPYAKLKNAKLGKTKVAKAFEQERNVIMRRAENHSGTFTDKWESGMKAIGEYVYDKGHKGAGVSLANKYSADPTTALRSWAFDLKLGLFAFPQLIVQTSHLFPIMAIAGQRGVSATASVPFVRIAIANGHPNMAKHIDKTIGKGLGFAPGDFEKFIDYLKKSGRMEIGQTVIEQSEEYSMALGHVNAARRLGRVFFNEGERIPRIAAANVAWKEYRAKFPQGNIDSPEAILWMTQRQDILTAGMTRASSTAWQKNSLWSIPTQFLSYSARMMEQLLSNRILTPGERMRLATAQLAMWGFTGAGMGWSLDHLVNSGYLEMDRDAYTVLRYGLIDWAIGITGNGRTAFAERLSIGEGFYDVFKKISQDSMVEVLGGPSVSVAVDVSSSVIQTIGDAIHGRTDLLTYDVGKIIRNASGANTLYNSWYLARVGEYYSRNANNLVAKGLGVEEAIMNLLGAPLQDVSLGYRMLELKRNEKDRLLEHGKRIQERWNLAAQAYESGDAEGAVSIIQDIGFDISILNGYEREQMRRFQGAQTMSLFEKAIKDAIMNPGQGNHRLGKLLAQDMQIGEDE